MTKPKMTLEDARDILSRAITWDLDAVGKTAATEAVFAERRQLLKAAYARLRGEEEAPLTVTTNPLGPTFPATYRSGDTALQRLDAQSAAIADLQADLASLRRLTSKPARWWAPLLVGATGAVLGETLVYLLRWLS